MRLVEGSTCVLRAYWWEDGRPEPGDFLRTDRGMCYRIDKYVLRVTRLARDAVQAGEPGVWRWQWATRPSAAARPCSGHAYYREAASVDRRRR